MKSFLLLLTMMSISAGTESAMAQPAPTPADRLSEVRSRVAPHLQQELATAGFKLGNPVFIRIFKESRELELWLKPKRTAKFKLWKTWPIAAMSGNLGPKLQQGDLQAPEGFYSVDKKALNPQSRFHLSFDIGYPNAYDQAHQCTGDFIMVHGNQVSIGCFAMTDPVIEEIYLLVESTLLSRQSSVPVHCFPFRMTAERLAQAVDSPWLAFWQQLEPGYAAFEKKRLPPKVRVRTGAYAFP